MGYSDIITKITTFFADNVTRSITEAKLREVTTDIATFARDVALNLDSTNILQNSTHRFVTDTEKGSWNAKEPAITATTSVQYYRGDKTFVDLNVAAVTGLQAALDAKVNKTPRHTTITSSATPTPNTDTTDLYTITALAEGAVFGAPTGTPLEGQALLIRIKDNGAARTLAFAAAYRFSSDLVAPITTVISKTFYLAFVYNATDSKWDNIGQINNI